MSLVVSLVLLLGGALVAVVVRRRRADRRRARGLEPISGPQGIWVRDPPGNRMIVNLLLLTEKMTLEQVHAAVRAWLVRANLSGPPFNRKLVVEGGRWHWQVDPWFVIDRQIKIAPVTTVRSENELEQYLESQLPLPLPPDRPPWIVQLIPDYQGHSSVLLIRCHRCLADGARLLDLLAPADAETTRAPQATGVGPRRTSRSLLSAALAAPVVLLQRALVHLGRRALPPLSGQRRIAWSAPIELSRLTRLAFTFEATVEDVVTTCVVGGIRRYLEQSSGEVVRTVRATLPIDLQTTTEPGDGQQARIGVDLPAEFGEPQIRLANVRQRLEAVRGSLEPVVVDRAERALRGALPGYWARAALDHFARRSSCGLTKVFGPSSTVELAERMVRGMMCWVPQPEAVAIAVVSYADALRITVMADQAVVPVPCQLVQAFEEELRDLENAWVLATQRTQASGTIWAHDRAGAGAERPVGRGVLS